MVCLNQCSKSNPNRWWQQRAEIFRERSFNAILQKGGKEFLKFEFFEGAYGEVGGHFTILSFHAYHVISFNFHGKSGKKPKSYRIRRRERNDQQSSHTSFVSDLYTTYIPSLSSVTDFHGFFVFQVTRHDWKTFYYIYTYNNNTLHYIVYIYMYVRTLNICYSVHR